MNFLTLIEAKRDGAKLGADQLGQIVREFTAGRIPDYQMAAFLMAICFRGLTTEETTALTLAMRDSGDLLTLPKDSRPVVDKHSTGGVGDKVSLPLAPLLACLGFRVPMISGRGLGITGGTLDKLDSIPGFKTLLPSERIREMTQSVGCVICGQTERMVPADRKLYALRDATGTVPSIPLIVSSILSKKLAEGLDALVLDVKFGAAAFMPGPEKARELAQAMVSLGGTCGVRTSAFITAMDAPLGKSAGNWLEVKESAACLAGDKSCQDMRELVLACAGQLLWQSGVACDVAAGRRAAEECLASGAPRAKWEEMLAAQGADLDAYRLKLEKDKTAKVVHELKASRTGFVSRCDARVIGEIVRDIGGGRLSKESAINYDVGVDRLAKPGERIAAGGVLARLHAAEEAAAESALARLAAAFEIAEEKPAQAALIREIL